MKWLYSLVLVVLLYFIVNALSAYIFRLRNPFKQLDETKKTLYLTFDDGIDSTFTPQLLDLLAQYKIKATFFIVAQTIEKNSAILKQMQDQGHCIALHSYEHRNQILQLPHQLLLDYKKSVALFNKHGITLQYFRAPWGHLSLVGYFLNQKYQLTNVFWNVIVQDWQKDTSPEIIYDKLLHKTSGNRVICLHDGRGKNNAPLKTISALQAIIPLWIEKGYQFEKVDQLV